MACFVLGHKSGKIPSVTRAAVAVAGLFSEASGRG